MLRGCNSGTVAADSVSLLLVLFVIVEPAAIAATPTSLLTACKLTSDTQNVSASAWYGSSAAATPRGMVMETGPAGTDPSPTGLLLAPDCSESPPSNVTIRGGGTDDPFASRAVEGAGEGDATVQELAQDAVALAVGALVTEPVLEAEALALMLVVGVTEVVPDAERVGVPVSDVVGLRLGLGLGVTVADTEGVADGDVLEEPDTVCDGVGDCEAVRVGEGVTDAVPVSVPDGVEVTVADCDAVTLQV